MQAVLHQIPHALPTSHNPCTNTHAPPSLTVNPDPNPIPAVLYHFGLQQSRLKISGSFCSFFLQLSIFQPYKAFFVTSLTVRQKIREKFISLHPFQCILSLTLRIAQPLGFLVQNFDWLFNFLANFCSSYFST